MSDCLNEASTTLARDADTGLRQRQIAMALRPEYRLSRSRANNPILAPLFIAGLRASFEETPGAFFNLSDEELAAPCGRIAVIFDHRDRVVAGARGIIDETGRLYIGQCFCCPDHRGKRLVDIAVAALRVDMFDLLGIQAAHLVIRVCGGEDNEPAARAYERVGFHRGGTHDVLLDADDPAHAHFWASSPDGKIVVREMDADQTSLPGCRGMASSLEGVFQ